LSQKRNFFVKCFGENILKSIIIGPGRTYVGRKFFYLFVYPCPMFPHLRAICRNEHYQSFKRLPWRRALLVLSLLAELWVVRSNPARV
jgi:hypothetical protein